MANRVNPKYASCLLSCGCMYSYGIAPPNRGDEVFCPKHGPSIVERGAEFRVSCERCSFRRGFGTARYNAIRTADGHRQRTGHAVNVTRGGDVILHLDSRDQPALPIGDDAPPF